MSVSPNADCINENMRKFWLTFENKDLEKEYQLKRMEVIPSIRASDHEYIRAILFFLVLALAEAILAFGGVVEPATAEIFQVAFLYAVYTCCYFGVVLYLRRRQKFWNPTSLAKNPTYYASSVFIGYLITPIQTLLFLNLSYVQDFECSAADSACSWAAADFSSMWGVLKGNRTEDFMMNLRGTFHKEFAFWVVCSLFFHLLVGVLVITGNNLSVLYTTILGVELFAPLALAAIYSGPGLLHSIIVINGAAMGIFTLTWIASFQDEARRTNFLLTRKQKDKIKHQSFELRKKSLDIREKDLIITETKEQLATAQRIVDGVMQNDAVLRQYAIAYKDLSIHESIGEGSFGTVKKGKLRGSKAVAIKTMRVDKVTKSIMNKFRNEIIIMTPLKHPNLIQMYGAVWTEGPDKLCIVLEFAENGSLVDVITPDAELAWDDRFEFAYGTALCFRYLHHELSETLIHRDLKPANILVDGNMMPKVGDFGESKRFDFPGDGDALTMTIVGTAIYMAPEILSGERYTKSVDTFSFALVLLEILVGNAKYVEQHLKGLGASAYAAKWRPPIPRSLQETHPALVYLVSACWSSEPRSRPEFLTIAPQIEAVKPRARMAATKGSNDRTSSRPISVLLSPEDEEGIKRHFESSSKTFTAFLSHHKETCDAAARIVKGKLDDTIEKKSFLDSDNLRDLRSLLFHVIDSDVLVLFQSKEVLQRPWCLLELYTAVTEGVPIVALNCIGKGYDFAQAADFLYHLETSLKTHNPGALDVLTDHGIAPARVAHALSSVVPNIISIPFNTSASENAIKATIADLAKAARYAKALPVKGSFEEWQAVREEKEREELMAVIELGTISLKAEGTIRGTMRGRMLQKLELVDDLKVQLAKVEALLAETKADAESREAMLVTQLERKDVQLEKKDLMIEKLMDG